MLQYHELEQVNIELANAVANHSADKPVAYKTVYGEPIYLGYFLPRDFDAVKRYPVLILIHGGGWSSHKVFPEQEHWAGDYLGCLARYYAEKGFVAVSVDYRLIRQKGQEPDYGIWDCYKDCCDAVEYVLTHAAEYGVDIERMCLLGESAGGHLAGMLIAPPDSRKFSFAKAFLVNPITDLLDEKWGWAAPGKAEREKLSPLHRADADTCEVILFHGVEDTTVNPEHSRKFYVKLQEMGVPCELHMFEKTRHAFLLTEYYQDSAACKMAIQIINEILDIS